MKTHTVVKFRSTIKEPYLLQLTKDCRDGGQLCLLAGKCTENEYEKSAAPIASVEDAVFGLMRMRLTMSEIATLHKEGKLSDSDVAAAMEILL